MYTYIFNFIFIFCWAIGFTTVHHVQRRARPDTGAAPIGVMTRICSCLHTFLIRVLMIVTRGGRSSIPFFKLFFVLMSLVLCEKIDCVNYVFIFQQKGILKDILSALQYLIKFALCRFLFCIGMVLFTQCLHFSDHYPCQGPRASFESIKMLYFF